MRSKHSGLSLLLLRRLATSWCLSVCPFVHGTGGTGYGGARFWSDLVKTLGDSCSRKIKFRRCFAASQIGSTVSHQCDMISSHRIVNQISHHSSTSRSNLRFQFIDHQIHDVMIWNLLNWHGKTQFG